MEDIHRPQTPIDRNIKPEQPLQQGSQQIPHPQSLPPAQNSPSPARGQWWRQRRLIIAAIAVIVIAVGLIAWAVWPSSGSGKSSKNPVVQSYQSKLPALKKQVSEKPKDANAHIQYGQALYVTGDKAAARDQYEAALKLNPKDSATYNNLGNVYRDLGNYSAAQNAYSQSIKLNPSGQNAYVNLANMQIYTLKKPAEGIATYKLAIKNIGDSPQFELLLGLAYEQNKQPSEAEATYKAILAKDSSNKAAQANLDRLENSK